MDRNPEAVLKLYLHNLRQQILTDVWIPFHDYNGTSNARQFIDNRWMERYYPHRPNTPIMVVFSPPRKKSLWGTGNTLGNFLQYTACGLLSGCHLIIIDSHRYLSWFYNAFTSLNTFYDSFPDIVINPHPAMNQSIAIATYRSQCGSTGYAFPWEHTLPFLDMIPYNRDYFLLPAISRGTSNKTSLMVLCQLHTYRYSPIFIPFLTSSSLTTSTLFHSHLLSSTHFHSHSLSFTLIHSHSLHHLTPTNTISHCLAMLYLEITALRDAYAFEHTMMILPTQQEFDKHKHSSSSSSSSSSKYKQPHQSPRQPQPQPQHQQRQQQPPQREDQDAKTSSTTATTSPTITTSITTITPSSSSSSSSSSSTTTTPTPPTPSLPSVATISSVPIDEYHGIIDHPNLRDVLSPDMVCTITLPSYDQHTHPPFLPLSDEYHGIINHPNLRDVLSPDMVCITTLPSYDQHTHPPFLPLSDEYHGIIDHPNLRDVLSPDMVCVIISIVYPNTLHNPYPLHCEA